MFNLFKTNFRTTLGKASFFAAGLALLASFTACDLGPDPDADGARFNKQFSYYDVQTCSYNTVSYDIYHCSNVESLKKSVQVGLRVDRDGLASLNLNGDRYYYTESQYSEGYDSDYGSYFHFYQDDDELTIYKDGSLIALWSSFDGTVTFYYHEYFYI